MKYAGYKLTTQGLHVFSVNDPILTAFPISPKNFDLVLKLFIYYTCL